ncbi:hypothetical protein DL98DRAFT_159814 [Cadophora sp. DSE1049]|nr:hypothetical protein DL98DRAFT_159814 [Cadophora sp. DSE1049]
MCQKKKLGKLFRGIVAMPEALVRCLCRGEETAKRFTKAPYVRLKDSADGKSVISRSTLRRFHLSSIVLSCEENSLHSRYWFLAPPHSSNLNVTINNNLKISDDTLNSDKPKDAVSKETIQTPISSQQPNSTLTTVPRMTTPEADSLMARFLTDTISNLTSLAPLPPNTPTGPKAMSQSLNASSAASKSASATPTAPRTKTRSPFSLVSQKQEFDPKYSQQSGNATPNAKRHTSWSRERQESPCPDGARKKSHGSWDHWSPGTKPRKDLFDDSPKGYRGVESAIISRKDGDRSLRRKFLEMKEGSTRMTKEAKEGRLADKTEGIIEVGKQTKKENLPILLPKAVEPSPRRKRYTGLLSIAVPGHGVRSEEKTDAICYNCGKIGHWFVNCLVKCGHCGGDGHKTMCCETVRPQSQSTTKKG